MRTTLLQWWAFRSTTRTAAAEGNYLAGHAVEGKEGETEKNTFALAD